MKRHFYDVELDVYVPGRWYLAEPTDLSGQEIPDVWIFDGGRPVDDPGPLRVPIDYPGRPLDYTTAGVSGPVLSARAASVLRELAPRDVQLFPVEVEGETEPYFLLNVVKTVRCIDDVASGEVRRYTPEDNRPDRVGEYRAVHSLRIDPSKVGDERVFRPWGWHPALIVDAGIKEALERTGFVGPLFDPV